MILFFPADPPYTAPPPVEAPSGKVIGLIMCIPFIILYGLMFISDLPILVSKFINNVRR